MSREERESYFREPPPEIRAKLLEMSRNPRPSPDVPEYDGPPIPELELSSEQLDVLAEQANGLEDIFEFIDQMEGGGS